MESSAAVLTGEDRGRRVAGEAGRTVIRKRSVLVMVGTIGLLAGCVAGPPQDLPFATHTVPTGSEIPSAEIKGVIELRDGCLTIGGSPVVLPEPVQWDEASATITVNATEFRVGDTITWGGAWTNPGRAPELPLGCPDGEVAMVYTVS